MAGEIKNLRAVLLAIGMFLIPEIAISRDKNFQAMEGEVGVSMSQGGVTLCWFNDARLEKMIERKVSNMCELKVTSPRDTDKTLRVNIRWAPSKGSDQCIGSIHMQFGIDQGLHSPFIEFRGMSTVITYKKRDYTKEKVTSDMSRFIRGFCQ